MLKELLKEISRFQIPVYSTGLFLLHHKGLSPENVTRWNALCVKGFIRKYLLASQEKDIYLFYTFNITRIRGQGAPDATITKSHKS